MRSRALLLVFVSFLSAPSEANAFWWLLRAAAQRGVPVASLNSVRSGAAAGTGLGSTELALLRGTSLGRYCVRPVNSRYCDYRIANSAQQAAEQSLGSQYQVRQAQRSGVFEVVDAIGKTLDVVEVLDQVNQHQYPQIDATNYGSYIQRSTQEFRSQSANGLTGDWRGVYICAQGLTGLNLRLVGSADGTVEGVFTFYPVPSNPGAATGRFVVRGTYMENRALVLGGGAWIERPEGYTTITLHGQASVSEAIFSGVVPECQNNPFTLQRQG